MLVFEWNFLGLSSETKPLNNEKVIDGSTFYECDTSSFFIYYNGNWYKQTFVTDDGINVYLYKFLMRKMFKNAFDTNISKTHVYNPEISSNISFTSVLPSNITEMEMYGDTYQQTYSGKNLCALGTKTVETYTLFPLEKSLPAGTYTFSAQVTSTDTKSSVCFVRFMNGSSEVGAARISRSDERTYITVTTSDTADGLYLYAGYNASDSAGDTATYTDIQIESGSSASPFEPYTGGIPAPNPDYPQAVQTVAGVQTVALDDGNGTTLSYTIDLGSTELCKIGDYQDYIYKSGDDWYLHKEIGKAVFDGSGDEDWRAASNKRISCDKPSEFLSFGSNGDGLCNQLSKGEPGNTDNTFTIGGSRIYMKALSKTGNPVMINDWKAWLGSNNLVLYSAIDPFTDTKITDAELISSLNSIMSYTFPVGLNYVTVSASNLPALLKLTITEKE